MFPSGRSGPRVFQHAPAWVAVAPEAGLCHGQIRRTCHRFRLGGTSDIRDTNLKAKRQMRNWQTMSDVDVREYFVDFGQKLRKGTVEFATELPHYGRTFAYTLGLAHGVKQYLLTPGNYRVRWPCNRFADARSVQVCTR
jgi:hypothetical protein